MEADMSIVAVVRLYEGKGPRWKMFYESRRQKLLGLVERQMAEYPQEDSDETAFRRPRDWLKRFHEMLKGMKSELDWYSDLENALVRLFEEGTDPRVPTRGPILRGELEEIGPALIQYI